MVFLFLDFDLDALCIYTLGKIIISPSFASTSINRLDMGSIICVRGAHLLNSK